MRIWWFSCGNNVSRTQVLLEFCPPWGWLEGHKLFHFFREFLWWRMCSISSTNSNTQNTSNLFIMFVRAWILFLFPACWNRCLKSTNLLPTSTVDVVGQRHSFPSGWLVRRKNVFYFWRFWWWFWWWKCAVRIWFGLFRPFSIHHQHQQRHAEDQQTTCWSRC